MKKTSVCALFTFICIVSFSFANCGSEKKEEDAITFLVTTPIRMDTFITKEYVAQIRSIRHIEVKAQEKGYLQKIFVDEGNFVKEGAPLFQVMPTLYQAELKKAEAEADFAEVEYKNTKRLADSSVVSVGELIMAQAKYMKAKADVKLAQTRLQFTSIRAPFSGIVGRFNLKLGSLVDEGDLITTLSDNSEMWVYFNVPEVEYLSYRSKIKSGEFLNVNLIMANGEYFEYPGLVKTIEADFNNETGNIAFRATFPNPKGLLRNGETGNVEAKSPLPHALIIPQKSTFDILDRKYVFVVNKDSIVHSREIRVVADMEDLYVIGDGLKEGDRILLEGLRKAKENDKIFYTLEDPKEAIHHLKQHAE